MKIVLPLILVNMFMSRCDPSQRFMTSHGGDLVKCTRKKDGECLSPSAPFSSVGHWSGFFLADGVTFIARGMREHTEHGFICM